MKFHKFIFSSIIKAALLGTIVGGSFIGINASANTHNDGPVSNGQERGGQLSKDFRDSDNNTSVDITDGYLNLDSTPTLNFGDNSSAVNDPSPQNNGNTLGLSSSQGTSSPLQVTDYRSSSNPNKPGNSNPTNWTLSAKVDNFNISGPSSPNTKSDQWHIMFSPNGQQTFNSDEGNTTYSQPNSVLSDSSNEKPIMQGGYGQTTINYDNSNNLAKLQIPYNVKPGNYSTNITWNLSTQVGSSSNVTHS